MSAAKITPGYRIEYFVLFWLNRLLFRLSHLSRRRIATILGYVFYFIFPYRKKIVMANLARAFPDESQAWRRRLARRTYIHFARVYFDIFATYQISDERFRQLIHRIDKVDLDQAVRQNKGVVILLFHFGNWELIADWLARNHYSVAAIAARLANPLADRLITETRTKNGVQVLPKGRRHTVKTYRFIRNDHLLYMIADQNAGKRGAWVRFFNQWTSSFRGPMLFALRKKCPVLLATCLMNERGKYDIRFNNFPMETPAGMSEEEKIEYLIQAYTRYFENLIRKNPDQYYWIHRRWKTKVPESLKKENRQI
jgi:KDO2-lipid IV(A) lauroyltransferase